MAAGVINLQKASGGITKVSSADGTGVTELVVPESGELIGSVGNQTIDGIKTFLKSPIVPTPTTGTQAVNKDYADLKVALSQFTGTNQKLTESGYQKLPGGLIIQWFTGVCSATPNTTVAINLPITFPNGILRFFATSFPIGSYVSCPAATNSSVSISCNIASAGAGILAIGY